MKSSENVVFERLDHVLLVTLNRVDKRNAFDEHVLQSLQHILDDACKNSEIRALVLNANGQHFCAGADLDWMQRVAQFTEEENKKDARILARLMHTLHHFPKPTISMVQGAAMGGGAGLVAASDIAIAANNARFCFSEVTLGLIPAVISPYVIKAIGERNATWLFMSAETFDAKRAQEMGLVHHCVPEETLFNYTLEYAHKIAQFAPKAVCEAKTLVRNVAHLPIDEALQLQTSTLIAKKRVSAEGQKGLKAFLNKETPNWD